MEFTTLPQFHLNWKFKDLSQGRVSLEICVLLDIFLVQYFPGVVTQFPLKGWLQKKLVH
jgi:hypothetical protein